MPFNIGWRSGLINKAWRSIASQSYDVPLKKKLLRCPHCISFPFCILLLTDIRVKIRATVFLTLAMRCSANDELDKKNICTISTRKPHCLLWYLDRQLLSHHDEDSLAILWLKKKRNKEIERVNACAQSEYMLPLLFCKLALLIMIQTILWN
jgi:hypothetical protein